MIKFLLRLIAFLFPIGVLLIAVEVDLAQMPNTYTQKDSFLGAHGRDTEVLVTGSSHALWGIDPNYFSHPGFNLANPSQDIYYDSLLVGKYLPDMPNLKLVIIPISYFSFEYSLTDSSENWRQFFYHRFQGLALEDDPIFDMRKYSYIALYDRDTILTWLLTRHYPPIDINSVGWYSFDSDNSTEISEESGINRVAAHEAIMKPDHISQNVRMLKQIIAELRSSNVEVAFITPPVFHTYSDNMNPLTYQQMQDTVQQLEKEYGVPYFNYLSDPRFTIDDFADNDHLNSQGAKKLSQILNKDVVLPLLN